MTDILLASDFSDMSPAQLRLAEAKYLFECFKGSRDTHPDQGLFLLTVFFDSFLFCLVSIEEMVEDETRNRLRALDSFMFFKALRNITTHHSVLSGVKGKFERPISRVVSIGYGCEGQFGAQFFLIPEKLEKIFGHILIERKGQKKTIEMARGHLSTLTAIGGTIMLVDVIEGVISDIEQHIV